MTIHDKAVRLCEGGVVECSGHAIRAVVIPPGFSGCDYCGMDSACNEDMQELCQACDAYDRQQHILKFNHNENEID